MLSDGGRINKGSSFFVPSHPIAPKEEWLPGAEFEEDITIEQIFYDSAKAAGTNFKEIVTKQAHKTERPQPSKRSSKKKSEEKQSVTKASGTSKDVKQTREKEHSVEDKGLEPYLNSVSDVLFLFKPGMLHSLPELSKGVVEKVIS